MWRTSRAVGKHHELCKASQAVKQKTSQAVGSIMNCLEILKYCEICSILFGSHTDLNELGSKNINIYLRFPIILIIIFN